MLSLLRMWSTLVLNLVLILWTSSVLLALDPIPRRLPPPGIKIPDDVRLELQAGLDKLKGRLGSGAEDAPWYADVMVFHKAVNFALNNGEFFDAKEFDVARKLLAAANERLDQAQQGKTPWQGMAGKFARGYRSRVDGSIQPYGLDIPAGLDLSKPVPLVVWLHGRGEKQCDLQFVNERMTRPSEFQPAGAIVLHPFGRQCVGYKSAGETDVLEAIEAVRKNYNIDPRRIALMGFSMGGAGVWHVGAHYTDLFCVVAPGAGFSETPKFLKLKAEQYPPWYEQTLWGQYDVPFYARNLLHVPLIAYSGEIDGQKQAADVMAAALAEHSYTLKHLIGPKTGHSYHPETKKEVLAFVEAALREGQPELPKKISLQTRTLKYHKQHWVDVLRLREHWQDTRVDANLTGDDTVVVTTNGNVEILKLSPFGEMGKGFHLRIDEQEFDVPPGFAARVRKDSGKWKLALPMPSVGIVEPLLTQPKRSGVQGPIDDAFTEPFLVVTPSGKSQFPAVEEWVQFELSHLRERWRTVFRAELPEKRDVDVTADDIKNFHLVCWGEPETNAVLKKITRKVQMQIPIHWGETKIVVGQLKQAPKSIDEGGDEDSVVYDRAVHVPVFVYSHLVEFNQTRNVNVSKYIVVNSGPTFREIDDANNSRQNPRLPDWAIIGLDQPPDINLPGRIVAADFFDESWKLKPAKK